MIPYSYTVAAVSTPRGKGGIAVIRISGADALAVADRFFIPAGGKPLSSYPARSAVFGTVRGTDGEPADTGIATVFRAPSSFTGEDTVEISCHGGTAVTEEVYLSAIAHGARAAGPGEFTRRAFLNGKLSLTEAEAVGLLIDADTKERLKLSSGGVRGNVSREIRRIYDGMLDTMTALYAAIDYPEEDVGDEGERHIAETLEGSLDRVKKLLATYKTGKAIADGVRSVICGRPNVGKSSIFNKMLGEEAAIVTSVEGTTRDIIRETVSFGGVTLRLSDTAGLRSSSDAVERIGIDRATAEIDSAELVIAVFDGSTPLREEDISLLGRLESVHAPVVCVINKSDLPAALTDGELAVIEKMAARVVHTVAWADSAGELDGSYAALEQLESAVAELFGSGEIDLSSDAVIWDLRQREQLEHCRSALESALAGIMAGDGLDCVCTLAEEAMAFLDETDGRGVEERIVNEIFARFCVGK